MSPSHVTVQGGVRTSSHSRPPHTSHKSRVVHPSWNKHPRFLQCQILCILLPITQACSPASRMWGRLSPLSATSLFASCPRLYSRVVPSWTCWWGRSPSKQDSRIRYLGDVLQSRDAHLPGRRPRTSYVQGLGPPSTLLSPAHPVKAAAPYPSRQARCTPKSFILQTRPRGQMWFEGHGLRTLLKA